jgi:hypothetical protein
MRIKLKMLLKGNPRKPQTKFVNPYAMSDPTTDQYRVKSEFRDGRFILKERKEESQMKQDISEVAAPVAAQQKKNTEPGFSSFLSEVVIGDLEKIANVSRRKAKAQPIMNPKDQIIQTPPALDLELLEPLFEPVEEPQQKEAAVPMQPMQTGNSIAVANLKRALDHWKTVEPRKGAK